MVYCCQIKRAFCSFYCCQDFSARIACTLRLGLSHYRLWKTSSMQNTSHQRHWWRFVFSFAVRCSLKRRHRPLFYSELHQPSTYCDLPESFEDRNGGYCLAKKSREALLDFTFQEDLCCTGPSFPLLSKKETPFAVFACTTALCQFSQTLNP